MADKDLSPTPCKSELETKFFEADINREHSDSRMRFFHSPRSRERSHPELFLLSLWQREENFLHPHPFLKAATHSLPQELELPKETC